MASFIFLSSSYPCTSVQGHVVAKSEAADGPCIPNPGSRFGSAQTNLAFGIGGLVPDLCVMNKALHCSSTATASH